MFSCQNTIFLLLTLKPCLFVWEHEGHAILIYTQLQKFFFYHTIVGQLPSLISIFIVLNLQAVFYPNITISILKLHGIQQPAKDCFACAGSEVGLMKTWIVKNKIKLIIPGTHLASPSNLKILCYDLSLLEQVVSLCAFYFSLVQFVLESSEHIAD